MSVDEIDMSQGSWTIMSRTTKALNTLSDQLRQEGILFSKNGYLSFDRDLLEAMHVWEQLQSGGLITVEEAQTLYSVLPKRGENARVRHGMTKKLQEIDPTRPLSLDNLVQECGLLAGAHMRPEDVVNLSKDDDRYLQAIKRRGEISAEPAVKLSTIHRMKGGEDQNIVLLSDMGYLPYKTLQDNPDDEHRVFYTAVTRTKENLHIVDTGRYKYPL
jgi:hypothetical protein